MKALVAIAMIFATTAVADAAPTHRHGPTPQPRADSFLGLSGQQAPVAPFSGDTGICRGGPCTLTGGPSGGPSQS